MWIWTGAGALRSDTTAILRVGIFSGLTLIIFGTLFLLLPWGIEKLGVRNPKLLENVAKFPYVAFVTGVLVLLLTMVYLFTSHLLLIWKSCP